MKFSKKKLLPMSYKAEIRSTRNNFFIVLVSFAAFACSKYDNAKNCKENPNCSECFEKIKNACPKHIITPANVIKDFCRVFPHSHIDALSDILNSTNRNEMISVDNESYGSSTPISIESILTSIDKLKEIENCSVLETGGWEIGMLFALAGAKSVTINDLSEEQINIAKGFEKNLREQYKLELVCQIDYELGNVNEIFDNQKFYNKFDIITSSFLIHFFNHDEFDRFITILYTISKENGYLNLKTNFLSQSSKEAQYFQEALFRYIDDKGCEDLNIGKIFLYQDEQKEFSQMQNTPKSIYSEKKLQQYGSIIHDAVKQTFGQDALEKIDKKEASILFILGKGARFIPPVCLIEYLKPSFKFEIGHLGIGKNLQELKNYEKMHETIADRNVRGFYSCDFIKIQPTVIKAQPTIINTHIVMLCIMMCFLYHILQ